MTGFEAIASKLFHLRQLQSLRFQGQLPQSCHDCLLRPVGENDSKIKNHSKKTLYATEKASERVLKFREEFKAAIKFQEVKQITVIIEDQASIHLSRLTKDQHQRWEEQGLYIFFLPSYSSELNRIENEWQRINEPIGRSDRLEKTIC